MQDKVDRGAHQLDSMDDVVNDIKDLRERSYFSFGTVMALQVEKTNDCVDGKYVSYYTVSIWIHGSD